MKIQDLSFYGRETVRLELLFSQYGLREATLYGISVSFLRETTIGVFYFSGNINKSQSRLEA